MSSRPFSVLIIVKGRQAHLSHVLEGIVQSNMQPNEIIIVHMNETAYTVNSELPIHQIELNDDNPLPLAKARNAAAHAASSEDLLFLDVDCIPEPNCFASLLADTKSGQLAMVNPQYLMQPVSIIDFDTFEHNAIANPARDKVSLGLSNAYEMFWSLGFAIKRSDFLKIGGFDERFTGYGGEDTDFAFTLRQQNIKLCYSAAVVYHQPHDAYDPPLNWFNDIVVNANVFKQKWGIWPMDGWLSKMEAAGYISWDDDVIKVVKVPTQDDIDKAKRTNAQALAQ